MEIPKELDQAPLAYENSDFLNSPDGRMLRIIAEYQEPMARFRRERIQDTVVFFGSARFRALDVASSELELLENTGSAQPAPEHEQPARPEEIESGEASALKLRLAEAAVEMAAYYEDARKLAGLVSSWAKSLPGPRHRFVVTSGGGPGIMEAANRGAYEAGCKTIGLNIKLPFEQHPNPYITPALNFDFHYFFMRKYWFAYLAKALVVFPGGFGTLDEMFELLTLAQTKKLAKKITIVVYGSKYWKSVINLDTFAEKGAIAVSDLDLFQFADTPEEAFAILKQGLTENHLESAYEHEQRLREHQQVPNEPAPNAQEMLGPDITKTR
ncbi:MULTISPECIES: TIGR00730 family Rossman fold protein [Acidobacteriaceae]|uniref:LOG family protein n=1 Tax=Acidobacteriaceae TaxID=204434 RepID=UPI00131D6427|nr:MULTISPECIES: TIGR00730 family Rossman fold protein [Acidobacteriaceae]MDW5267010.1 TIGR00730 family Rossman fold protein [Edaphobacter sp.]